MDKVKKWIFMLINIVTIVLLIAILITSLLFINFVWNNLHGWQETLLVLIIFTLLFVIFNKLKMLSNKALKKIALLNALLIIGLSIYVFASIHINPGFDTYYCFTGANEYLNHHFDWNQINPGIKHYLFYRCTNLLPLTYSEVFLQGILQFLGVTNPHTIYQLLCGLNFVMFWMAIYLVYRLIQRRFSQYLATGFTLLTLLFWPFFVILDMFYTDWPAMLMTIGILVNYDALLHSDSRRQQLKRVILIIICAVLGTLMKSNVLIVLLAIIIHYWLRTSSFKKWIVLVLVLIIPTGILVKTSNKLTLINAPYSKSELGFPVINWPLMSLNDKYATYDDATMQYTANLKKHHSVAEVAKIEEKQYLQEIFTHPLKFIDSLFTHIKEIYTDGTDGSLLLTTWSAENNGKVTNLVSKLVYANGPYRNVYLAWTTAFNLTMILLILIGVIIRTLKKETVAYVDALILTVLGNMLLLLIWEARSRYLLMIEPIMICLACWGIDQILMTKQLLFQKANKSIKIKRVVNK